MNTVATNIPESISPLSWDFKLGLIVPSWNTVMEREFQRLLPAHGSLHASRIFHNQDTEESLMEMLLKLEDAATLLAHAKVDAICFGCTGSGLVQEDVYLDRKFADKASLSLGIPVIATSDAVVKAMEHLRISRVSVASPYEPWLNAHLKRYLNERGIVVTSIAGFGTQDHSNCSPKETLELALSVVDSQAEAIFISCTNFRTLEIIEPLENATGLPVITSTQASYWMMSELIKKSNHSIQGLGKLFS